MPQTVDLRTRRPGAVSVPTDHAGRVPPHNLQAEESLLGAMLLSRDAIGPAVEACAPGDFYKPAHSHIFEAIISLWGRGEPADPVTVADELARADLLDAIGGPSVLISLQANTPATTNAPRYARIVEEHALLRKLIMVAGDIAEMGYSVPEDITAAVDQAEALVFNVAQRRVADTLSPIRDLLAQSLDRLEALYDRGEAITGVPTGFTDLDDRLSGLQPSSLVIIGARPAMGKCVAWDTPIVDPNTGEIFTAAEVHRRGEAGETVDVLSLDENRRLRVAQPSAYVDDGVKPVFRVTTKLGRQVRTTLSHPFLTPSGWTPLGGLDVGNKIAVPSSLPVFGLDALPEHELNLLACLLSDGASCDENPSFTSNVLALVNDAAHSAWALGARSLRSENENGSASVTFVGQSGAANPMTELLRRHGLLSCPRQSREVPVAIYRLPKVQLASFLSRLLSSGASFKSHGRAASLRWRTASEPLARAVQHLLLRFEVNASLHVRSREHSFEVGVTEASDLRRFSSAIGLFARTDELARHVDSLAHSRERRVLVGAGVQSGEPSSEVFAPTLWESAAAFLAGRDDHGRDDHGRVRLPHDSDIRWDEIVSITYEGEEQVYDLTVPHLHNFVAGDILVHNTSFALNVVSHAALTGAPVLFFSLEMSHLEITQRLLCSEARVDASRLRNGRLHDSDWPKINHAIGRLGEAPIFIDDNPNVTVMDIRAKARRLKSAPGGLGLVVIDYMQLMSGRSNAENRQVEVSEMSRGLKILARELNVPVIALSQLSRALELRADKRPTLADLRESGSLEQDADVVMFLYRDEVYNSESPDKGTAEVIVAKHRNGPVGTTQLAFIDRYTRFANMARV